MKNTNRMLALVAIALVCENVSSAQPTYKCTIDGKTSYSDAPCRGATIVDTTPTQGMDKMSGQRRIGKDVQREHWDKAFGEAIQPITGLTPKQLKIEGQRQKLSVLEKQECRALDAKITDNTADAETLYRDRKRFNELKC